MDGGGQRSEIAWVRAEHEVVAAQSPLDDSAIDDIAAGSPGQQRSDPTSLRVVEILDVASEEQPRQTGLAPAAGVPGT